MLVRTVPLVVAALLTILPTHAHAQLRARLLASGFDRPNGVVFDPVVPGAAYVVDQVGVIRAFLNGVERPTLFLDIHSLISGGYSEQGLLGLAFPPDAATSGRVFVHFTNTSGNSVVARYTRSIADPMVLDPSSRFDLKWPDGSGGRQGFISQPFENHNGGNLVFGPDGYLYIGMGDGGSGDDPLSNAQNPAKLLGKMLRIDVSVPANDPVGYAIPATNPVFTTATAALPEIWSFGLRNPWRYSFDDLGAGNTGALVIGDVGQGAREEIDFEPVNQGGRNYGWRVYEGTRENFSEAPAYFPLTNPVFEYTHAVGQAITGGYVYRGAALGARYQGRYFYADCVQGRIWSLGLNIDGAGEATPGTNLEHSLEMGGRFNCVASFARDSAGELYFMDFNYATGGPGTGRIFKIELATASAPGVPTGLASTVQGTTVTIDWSAPATGGTATGYVLEAGTTPGASNVGVVPTTATTLGFAGVPTGQYFVRVRATNTAGTSAASSDLTVNVGCTPPTAPATFITNIAGTTVTLAWDIAPGTTSTIVDVGYAPGATALTLPYTAPAAVVGVPNVPPGSYYVRTRAVNACGASAPSVERTVVIQ
ncbi:MAG: PQQ-dependent sugar dehydrogenase [Acidobacteriota bacterium]